VKKQVEKSSWQTNDEAAVTVTGIHSHPTISEDGTIDSNLEDGGQSVANRWPMQTATQAPPAPPQTVPAKQRSSKDPKPIPPLNKEFSDEAIEASANYIITDTAGEIVLASPGFAALTGYSLAECAGRNCRFLQGKETNPKAIRQISMACQFKREIRIILLNYKKDGTPFWNLLHITPIQNSTGKHTSFVEVSMDVSLKHPSPNPA